MLRYAILNYIVLWHTNVNSFQNYESYADANAILMLCHATVMPMLFYGYGYAMAMLIQCKVSSHIKFKCNPESH